MSSQFGHLFRITSWGESHGGAIGVVVDGCPPGLALSEADLQPDLDRRRPGQNQLVTQRNESDTVQILSGVFEGLTTGTPISLLVWNKDAKSSAYDEMSELFRPSHADYTYQAKYGHRNWQGGGRASARETVGRVAAGAIAKKLLRLIAGTEVVGWVSRIGAVSGRIDPESVSLEAIEASIVRCPDPTLSEQMIAEIQKARKDRDTVGGIVECIARPVPVGWGEPVFDKLEADLGKAVLSIPACKGFEVGSGFAGTQLRGSEHNDPFYHDGRGVRTRTNHSGGIQGGITNGEPVICRAAFKPVATIFKEQETVNRRGESVRFTAKGRHDPCVVARAVPIVEAMVALVLVDHALRQKAQRIL
ncbi:MAG: chorismate synthase [Myxococcales bacterium]|nr:chorismate synthase [Myxococcales bacterium]